MSEAARNELASWGEELVGVSRSGPGRCELLLHLHQVGRGFGPETTVSLYFEGASRLWIENIDRADVTPHAVVLHDVDGHQTRVTRLVLPKSLERALHVGQFAARDLRLPTLVTPFVQSWNPPASSRRPRDVVVWSEFAAKSRLTLWWTCASFPTASVWVVPMPRYGSTEEEICGVRNAQELMTAAPSIQRLTKRQVGNFAANWKRWSSGDARFRRVQMGEAAPRWMGDVPEPIFDLLPRLEGQLQLAPYDEELLKLLGTQWSSTLAAIMRLLKRPDTRLMQVWGDLGLHRRLHQWSRWKSGRYVEHRLSQSDKAFSGLEYRLTPEGERLLDGLPSLDVAPPLIHGAFRFYTAGSWVMTGRGPNISPRRLSDRRQ